MVSSGDWIPGLHLCGRTQTGKSTKGKFVFVSWRLLGTKYERLNIVGFTLWVLCQLRRGFALRLDVQFTQPYLMVSALAAGRNNTMVELIKHAAENTNSRSKYNNDGSYVQELALSNILLLLIVRHPKTQHIDSDIHQILLNET